MPPRARRQRGSVHRSMSWQPSASRLCNSPSGWSDSKGSTGICSRRLPQCVAVLPVPGGSGSTPVPRQALRGRCLRTRSSWHVSWICRLLPMAEHRGLRRGRRESRCGISHSVRGSDRIPRTRFVGCSGSPSRWWSWWTATTHYFTSTAATSPRVGRVGTWSVRCGGCGTPARPGTASWPCSTRPCRGRGFPARHLVVSRCVSPSRM